jgi:hypothetical protein
VSDHVCTTPIPEPRTCADCAVHFQPESWTASRCPLCAGRHGQAAKAARDAAYRNSPKGREARRAAKARYRKSDAGRAARRRIAARRRARAKARREAGLPVVTPSTGNP